MKKKLISIILAITVVICMTTACGGSSEPQTPVESKAEVTPAEVKTEENVQEVKEETKPAEERKAVEVAEGDFHTYDLEDGTIGIDAYNGEATDVIVPSTIGGKTVTEIDMMNAYVTSVVLPDTVRKINKKAFFNCDKLESIDMGNGLKEIDEWAFELCGPLKEVYIPDSVEKIGEGAFVCCDVENIHISTSLNEIIDSFGNSQIKSINIPGNVKKIDEEAFNYCYNLTEVVFEEGVEYIETHSFSDCDNLKKAIIPSSVNFIGKAAFKNAPEDFTIVAPAGSYAESYALEHEFNFEAQ